MTMIYLVAYSRTSHLSGKEKQKQKKQHRQQQHRQFRAHSVHALD